MNPNGPECRNHQEKLVAFLDSEMGWDERNQVLQHLMTCPACQQEYLALAKIKSGLRELREYAPSSHASDRIRREAGIRRPSKVVHLPYQSQWRRYLAWAAGIVLVISLSAGSGYFGGRHSILGDPTAEGSLTTAWRLSAVERMKQILRYTERTRSYLQGSDEEVGRRILSRTQQQLARLIDSLLPEGEVNYLSLMKDYQAGARLGKADPEEAARIMVSVAEKDPRGPLGNFASLRLAEIELVDRKDVVAARKIYESLGPLTGDEGWEVYYGLAECARMEGDFQKADGYYSELVKGYPKVRGTPAAQYELAQMRFEEMNDFDTAREAYLQLTREWDRLDEELARNTVYRNLRWIDSNREDGGEPLRRYLASRKAAPQQRVELLANVLMSYPDAGISDRAWEELCLLDGGLEAERIPVEDLEKLDQASVETELLNRIIASAEMDAVRLYTKYRKTLQAAELLPGREKDLLELLQEVPEGSGLANTLVARLDAIEAAGQPYVWRASLEP